FVTIASEYKGKKFDSPNDAVLHPSGAIYFTDPPYGLEKFIDDSSKAAPYQGVYRVRTTGEVDLLVDSIPRPNGIGFLPGGKTLLVANSESERAIWYAYDLGPGDSLVNPRIFFDASSYAKTAPGGPDGFKVDAKGNVFATGPGGIWIFNAEGKPLGRIKLPVASSNVALADDDKTLYITADMNLLRVKLR
ncbi:SMP-30/gluconolactonase/LRE family protein, partial [Flavihumibacter sp. CACIAM 22H1]|uniref:SMP-30/gluconolactonase/LRE family protein n=1 Tax=Flavihumibacter sp. CACIAM 22H1 TaxID=1812911 RepID=UPI0025C44C72